MMMDENPYEAPKAFEPRAIGILSGDRADLRGVAYAQKGILTCILMSILSLVGMRLIPPPMAFAAAVAYLVFAVAATVFVFRLAIKVYSVGTGVLLGILTLIPCVGLIVLLSVNGKATKILQLNGYRVGLLGAKLSDFPPSAA